MVDAAVQATSAKMHAEDPDPIDVGGRDDDEDDRQPILPPGTAETYR